METGCKGKWELGRTTLEQFVVATVHFIIELVVVN